MTPERRLDRLLARGRLARPEQERIFAAVLEQQAPRRRWLVRLSWLAPALAAAVVLPLVLWPRAPGFRAKGGAGGAAVEASCAGGCSVGGTLVYRVDARDESGYLAAFAVDGAGERTWHFPSAKGELPRVERSPAPVLLSRGIRLTAPGAQSVEWLLLRRPLAREQIAALADGDADVIARGTLRVEVAP